VVPDYFFRYGCYYAQEAIEIMAKYKEVIGCKYNKECEADNELTGMSLTGMSYTCCSFCSIKGECPNESKQCNEVPDTCDGVIAV